MIDEDINMTPDDVIGCFLFGLSDLHVTDDGLAPDNDAEHLQAVGTLSVLVYRIAAASEAPYDLALARLATLTGGLLLSSQLGGGPEIVQKWRLAKAEVVALQLAGNR